MVRFNSGAQIMASILSRKKKEILGFVDVRDRTYKVRRICRPEEEKNGSMSMMARKNHYFEEENRIKMIRFQNPPLSHGLFHRIYRSNYFHRQEPYRC